MNYRQYFIDVIRKNFKSDPSSIEAEVENHFKLISVDTKFGATSKNPIDRRLDFCGYFLAFIKTLDGMGLEYETIRKLSLEVVTAYVQPRNRLHALVKRIPARVVGQWWTRGIVKLFAKRVGANENKNGFIARIITDKSETYGLGYGVDIIECGICKLFYKHHYAKYAPILCEVDKITSELAGLELIRTGTIANGAEKCDFRFRRAK